MLNFLNNLTFLLYLLHKNNLNKLEQYNLRKLILKSNTLEFLMCSYKFK